MRPIFLALFISTISYFQLMSQHQNHPCAFDFIIEQLDKKYPGYKTSVNKTFKDAKQNRRNLNRSSTTYNIPVVVHIVWNEEEERISESLIASQIDVLNEDFQRLNDDADNIREIFKDVVGNPMIQFTLEEIIYVETDALFDINVFNSELADDVKRTSAGGSDARDVDRFLNIWVCKIQPLTLAGQSFGQILGYAYPPNDLDNWPPEFQLPAPNLDGVVVDYRVMGRNNPFSIDPGLGYEIQFEKGRTVIHEVGHYLGLRHIWGDGDFSSPTSCNFDDGIEDTPNSGSPSSYAFCDTTLNTCQSNPIEDLPDMVENYMDYSNEICQNSFTIGQIELMRSVLENQRCQLIQVIDNCSVSTNNSIEISLDIMPNPSSGLFYLNGAQLDLTKFDIKLYDISGKIFPLKISSNLIDLSGFNSGIYILNGSNDTQVFKLKLIKQ